MSVYFFAVDLSTEKKKKIAFKKADGKKEIHHSSSLTSSSKVQPADDMADMAAVNPNAEGITSPVGSPAAPLPVSISSQGNITIPPPPRQQIPAQNMQQRGNWPQQQYQMAGYVVPNQQPQVQLHCQAPPGHFIPAPFPTPGQPPVQVQGQFVTQPYQGHYPVPQYPQAGGTPAQAVVYGNQVVAGSHHPHVLTRAQSLPSSASHAGTRNNSTTKKTMNTKKYFWNVRAVTNKRQDQTTRSNYKKKLQDIYFKVTVAIVALFVLYLLGFISQNILEIILVFMVFLAALLLEVCV